MRSFLFRHRESLSGLINLGGSRLLLTGMSFLSSILIARALSVEQLGIFALITGAFAYVSIFSDFGLRAIITAEAARRDDINAVFGVYIQLRLFIALTAYLVSVAAAWFFYPVYIKPVAVVMLSIFFFALQLDWILLVRRQYRMAGGVALVRWSAYLALILIATQFLRIDIDLFAHFFLYSWICSAFCSWCVVMSTGRRLHFQIDKAGPKAGSLLKTGMPVLGATLVGQALQNADLFWVGKIFGVGEAGHYYLASSIVGAGLIFANAIGQMASAQYASLQDDVIGIVEKLKSDIRLLTLVSVAVAMFVLFGVPSLVPIFFGRAYVDTGALIINFVPYLILYHLWSLLFSASIALGMETVLFKAKLVTIVLLPVLLSFAASMQLLSAFAFAKGLMLLPAIFLIYQSLAGSVRRKILPTLMLYLLVVVLMTALVVFVGDN